MNNSVIHRIRNGVYTDADCQAYLVGRRNMSTGFAREVGDFIAHPNRDRGSTYDLATRVFSQFAFFYFFKHENPVSRPFLGPIGPCPWWFKPWLMSQSTMFSNRDLQAALGCSAKQLRKQIREWFPDKNERYPEWVECSNEVFFRRVVEKLSTLMGGQSIFTIQEAWDSIAYLFESDAIECSIEDFMVCVAVVLSKTEVELPHQTQGIVDLSVQPYSFWPAEEKQEGKFGRRMFFTHPHGTLHANISVRSPDLPIGFGMEIIDFEIDTRRYFDANTFTVDEHGLTDLDKSGELAFDAQRTPPVYSISEI